MTALSMGKRRPAMTHPSRIGFFWNISFLFLHFLHFATIGQVPSNAIQLRLPGQLLAVMIQEFSVQITRIVYENLDHVANGQIRT